jgi:hypothetical protein
VQGGSDGMPILGDFAIKYGALASHFGVPTDDLYQALVDTAENTVRLTVVLTSINTNELYFSLQTGTEVGIGGSDVRFMLTQETVGRQNTAWKMFNYIPTDWVDPSGSTGLPTREASRAYEVSEGS